ncbi:MAG: hypothetical protein ACKO8X_05975 [Verrucomicrobiota bacterium]
MSVPEFDALVGLFLEGSASREQAERLRQALASSAELRDRFHSRRRLHQAQLQYLSRREERTLAGAMLWLNAFGQRIGRCFAHLCLLGVIMVQLQVTIPAEYSGLLWYVDAAVAEEADQGVAGMPGLIVSEIVQEFDLSQVVEVPSSTMPNLVMPEMPDPAEESGVLEV